MATYHVEKNVQDVYLRNNAKPSPHEDGQSYVRPSHNYSPEHRTGIPTYKSAIYSHPEKEETQLKQAAYSYSPRSHPPEPIYHNQEYYARSSHHPPSPGPPPYSAVMSPTRGSSLQYTVSPTTPEHQTYRSAQHYQPDRSSRQGRAPSPFQDRQDYDTTVPTYSTAYPTSVHSLEGGGVSSKLVYTTKTFPHGQGFVQSRSMGAGRPQDDPTSPGRSSSPMKSPNPRPYQLKPTLDSVQDNGHPLVSGGRLSSGSDSGTQVDALTDLLMKNMRAAGDPDFFGMCAKCGQSIMGENTGCTALDQLFHIGCFTCVSCDACLRGQPFFAMEGKPYCEACYLNTLEKCSVCSKPITDRVLRATGKPYHPACFTCVVCGKSLDGIPFTVDATSQIHCIEDFHRKFAPRCCVCNNPILPSSGQENLRIVALDRSFHVQCYKCEDCGVLLSSKSDDGGGCYPLDDHILCQSCNAQRINALTTKLTTEL